MCGRFTLRRPMNLAVGQLMLDLSDLPPRYNIAPTQLIAVVRDRKIAQMRWGLIPQWSKTPTPQINARSDTVANKPAFREAYRNRRCLVLADGFFEWKQIGKSKQPYLFEYSDQRTFAFAGIWERWQETDTCAIITTDANELGMPIHDRMPVILDPHDYETWLNPRSDQQTLDWLLRPTAEGMTVFPVNSAVNSAKNDSPDCVRRDSDRSLF
jgi:putative SOS response-associated peptidase YedK